MKNLSLLTVVSIGFYELNILSTPQPTCNWLLWWYRHCDIHQESVWLKS